MAVDLRAISIQDSHDIINGTLGTGSFAQDLIFTDLETVPNTITIKGWPDDTGIVGIDFETGLAVSGSKISIKFHQSDLAIWDGLASLQRWKIQFVNGAGQTIICEINDVFPDRSFGDILVNCKIISGHR